jgi:GNAT superfamily N-acetyltransferase
MALSSAHQVKRAARSDAKWIVGLSSRVQSDLTSKGSAQIIGPLALQSVESSLQNGHCFILGILQQHDAPIYTNKASVLIDEYSSNYALSEEELNEMPEKKWFLHAMMIEPECQGKGLGRIFLREVLEKMGQGSDGVVLLDCFAGNKRLRAFYEGVGFALLREVPEEDYMVAVFTYKLGQNIYCNEPRILSTVLDEA